MQSGVRAVKREAELLQQALDFARCRAAMISAHLIKARAGAMPIDSRRRQLEQAIVQARMLVDELVTKRTALGWQRRDGDAA
ncbi:hypothetical protein ACVWXN_003507 [Bradyrhizobium sp. i1.4.4]